MRIRDLLVPDEMQSAFSAAKSMLAEATLTSHFWIKQIFAALVPAALGFYLAWYLTSADINIDYDNLRSIVYGIMTLVTVLAGFMVTLMLFTGRSASASSLPIDDAQRYVGKVKYLLFSQAATLAAHVLVIVAAIGWLTADIVSSEDIYQRIFFASFSGAFFLSLIRTLLLPFQIYEIHEFELNAMIDEKKKAIRKQLDKEHQARS